MFWKKFGLLLLLVVYGVHSMDIAPKIDAEKWEKLEIEKKCKKLGHYFAMSELFMEPTALRKRNVFFARLNFENPAVKAVFRYKKAANKKATNKQDIKEAINFIERVPDIKFCDLITEFDGLSPNVAQEVLLSQRNAMVIVGLHKDVLRYMCSYLPESYEDHGGFFNPENHEGIICKKVRRNPGFFLVAPFVDDLEEEEEEEESKRKTELKNKSVTVTREKMFKALQDKSMCQVLSTFRYVEQKGIRTNAHYDNVIIDASLAKEPTSYTPSKEYYFTYEDLLKMTPEQEQLLRDIVEYSSRSGRNIDKRFKITEKHIELLLPLKDFILGNELLRDVQIIVDITPPTIFEIIKDKSLFFLPHLLVVVAPDLVHSQTNGLLQGTTGFLATSFGSAALGNWAYPFFDTYNSGVGKLSKWFGPYNHTRINKGLGFGVATALHYIGTALAQKLWSWGTMPWQSMGIMGEMMQWQVQCMSVLIHTFRVFLSLLIIEEIQDYKNPFRRPNKNGKPFTLGDLVSGPKFTAKE